MRNGLPAVLLPLLLFATVTAPASAQAPPSVSSRTVNAVLRMIDYVVHDAHGTILVVDSAALRATVPLTAAEFDAVRRGVLGDVRFGTAERMPECNTGGRPTCLVMRFTEYAKGWRPMRIGAAVHPHRGCGSHETVYRVHFRGEAIRSMSEWSWEIGDCFAPRDTVRTPGDGFRR
jgi:hypothetical protein